MSLLYSYRTGIVFTLSDSADAVQHDVNMTLRYTVYPARAATLEEPGEGASVSIQGATITTRIGTQFAREDDAPDWLWPFLESDEELQAELLAHAADLDEYARDQVADLRREEARLGDAA